MNNSESIGTTVFPEHVEALLDFIEKEPVMKWLLCRVAQAWQSDWETITKDTNPRLRDSHWETITKDTNQTLRELNWIVLTTTYEDEDGDWRLRTGVDAMMSWEREEWALWHAGTYGFFIGKTLEIQNIISYLELTGHEIMEAERMYGEQGAAPNQYAMTERTMIAEILSQCAGTRWQDRDAMYATKLSGVTCPPLVAMEAVEEATK